MSRIVAEVLDPGSCKMWADQELCLPQKLMPYRNNCQRLLPEITAALCVPGIISCAIFACSLRL